MQRLTRTALFVVLVFVGARAQTANLIGFVYDASNGEALVGANVYVNELQFGASTNLSGYFVVPDVPTGDYVVSCSYVGYESQSEKVTVKTGAENSITFELAPQEVTTEEVVVTADSIRTSEKLFVKEVSKMELTLEQINRVPQAVEADLLRTLQTMPGVTAVSDFSSALYVRGGTPDQNLFLMDGADVYNPEHAFGIFSTFNTNAIKKVEISKGGFGAEYGGRLSSVLDVVNDDGNRKEFEGTVNVSMISGSATLQAPMGDLGSISASFRRTYIDQTLAKAIDDIPAYYFYDGNVKAFFDLGRNDKLSVSFFTSKDDLDMKPRSDDENAFEFDYNWGNMTGSANWRHIFTDQLFASFWLTGSRFESDMELEIMDMYEDNYLSDYTFKAALEYYPSQSLNLKFGGEQKLFHEMYKFDTDFNYVDVENNKQLSTLYASSTWRPTPLWEIDLGARGYMFSDPDTTIMNGEPRLTVKYRLDEFSSVKAAGGYYHQYMHRIPRLFLASIWAGASRYVPESSGIHAILGYQREVAGVYQLEVEAYWKHYKNLFKFNEHTGVDAPPDGYDERGRPMYTDLENIFLKGNGNSYGVEAMLRKDVGAITGWLSYAYSRTLHDFPTINRSETFPPRHDREHVVNAVANFNLTRLFGDEPTSKTDATWNFGTSFVFASGQPITTAGSAYFVSSLPDQRDLVFDDKSVPNYTLYPGEINDYRMPPYMRLDVSLTYTKNYETWTLEPYLQIFNVGYRRNVWYIQYNEKLEDGALKQEVENITMLPILPSLGVKIKF